MHSAITGSRREPPVGRRPGIAALATALALVLSAPLPVAAADLGISSATQAQPVPLPSLRPLVQRVLPAVVNISVREKAGSPVSDDGDDDPEAAPDTGPATPGFPPSPFDQFLRRFFDQHGSGPQGTPVPEAERTALGSGFIIDPDGYVVTNNHVVADADRVTVILQDGTRMVAKLIGRDIKTDLALLKISSDKPLPYVSWGDSAGAGVGDWVVAVGNPFGLGGTVSAGIISARSRQIDEGPYDDFLQIDAPINRGNSGGPTFDLSGKVIGINTAIYSPNGGSVGIGFAIPSDLARPVIEQLKAHGKVERGWLGVQVQEMSPALAQSLGLPHTQGALIDSIDPDGPAAKSGMQRGDVILGFDGRPIERMRDLPIIVAEMPAGRSVKVELWRDGARRNLDVTIGHMSADQAVALNGTPGGGEHSDALGVTLAPLDSNWRERLGVSSKIENGVVVAAVDPNSPLAEIGIQAGDVIESVDRKPATGPRAAAAALEKAEKGQGGKKSVLILLNRHGAEQFVALSQEGSPNNG